LNLQCTYREECHERRSTASPSKCEDPRKAEKGDPDDGACSVCTEASSSDQTVPFCHEGSGASTPERTPGQFVAKVSFHCQPVERFKGFKVSQGCALNKRSTSRQTHSSSSHNELSMIAVQVRFSDVQQGPIPEDIMCIAELICCAARSTQQSDEVLTHIHPFSTDFGLLVTGIGHGGLRDSPLCSFYLYTQASDLAVCLSRLLMTELQKRKRRRHGFWHIICKVLVGCFCILAVSGLVQRRLSGAAPFLLPPS
jgi:hypothetical protein